MKPLKHQVEKSRECYDILKSKGLVYLAGEVRSGKTLTAILTAEMTKAEHILVLTKKAAIPGWMKFSEFFTKQYNITNYEQVTKLSKDNYDLIIVDEAHNLGQVGKPSKRVKDIRKIALNKPVILMSGTPHAETKASMYHQMCITKYSPFNQWKNFYRFFDVFGILETQYIAGRLLKVYKKTKPEIDIYLQDYWVRMTQEDAGIMVEQEEELHYIELDKDTKALYNQLLTDKIAIIDGEEVVCDSDMKLRVTLHQLEFSDAHVNYIYKNFKGKVALMAHFIKQQEELSKIFPYFDVFSSNRHKEGVDLSMYDHFVIVSNDYSGAGHLQRMQRNVNINNTKATKVHHLLVEGGISDQVYKAVSQKKDFNNSVFKKETI